MKEYYPDTEEVILTMCNDWSEVEPELIQLLLAMTKLKRSLTIRKCISLANDSVDGSLSQKNYCMGKEMQNISCWTYKRGIQVSGCKGWKLDRIRNEKWYDSPKKSSPLTQA